jgi:hypothetical protein
MSDFDTNSKFSTGSGSGTCSCSGWKKPPSTDSLLQEYFEFEESLLDGRNNNISGGTPSNASGPAFNFKEANEARTSFSYLNHASFGDPYESTLKLRQYLTDMWYRQPMVYHRSLVPPLMVRAKERPCKYLKIIGSNDDSNGRDDEFSFVNITATLFSVLGSIHFEKGDVIVTSDMLYHSLVDILMYLSQNYQLTWIQVPTPDGAKLDDTYNAFEGCLQQQQQQYSASAAAVIRLLIVDHISSKPSVVFPVERICQLCRSLDIPTLVDGAHVPGAIPSKWIHTEQIGATLYAVTFHKWCNTPRGGASGGLWVNKKDCQKLFSSFIDLSNFVVHGGWADTDTNTTRTTTSSTKNNENSHHNNKNDVVVQPTTTIQLYLNHTSKSGFFTDGLTQGIYDESTREYENVLVLPHCLDLVLHFEEDFQQHAKSLRWASMKLLQQKWELSDSETMRWYGDVVLEEKSNNSNNKIFFELPMLSIPLPAEQLILASTFSPSDATSAASRLKRLKKYLVPTLWEKFGIEVPIFVWKTTHLGVRLSFGRHVTLDDVHKLGDAILCIIDEGMSFLE